MVNVIGSPEHSTPALLKYGVTLIVAVAVDVVEFVAGNAGIFPVPLEDKPIDGLSFVHLYVVVPPVFTVLKAIWVVLEPLHIVILLTALT